MHYLKAELERLKKYAAGLGIKVTMTTRDSPENSAEWVTDGSEIIIYQTDKHSPLMLCLLILHELAHHMAWIYTGRKGDLKTDRALDAASTLEKGEVLDKKYRKAIYESERDDSKYQLIIHHEIGSKISVKRLQEEIDYDVWVYRYYYLKGKWPTLKEKKQKRRELKHGI
jgi:hypothetical protein